MSVLTLPWRSRVISACLGECFESFAFYRDGFETQFTILLRYIGIAGSASESGAVCQLRNCDLDSSSKDFRDLPF